MGVIVGATLAGITVNKKESVAVAPSSSVTVSVIVVDPIWSAAGVIVTVRFSPLPLNTMFASGTSKSFDEAPETTSEVASDSGSETLKSIAGVGVLTTTDCWTTSDIVGRALLENTVNTNRRSV